MMPSLFLWSILHVSGPEHVVGSKAYDRCAGQVCGIRAAGQLGSCKLRCGDLI